MSDIPAHYENTMKRNLSFLHLTPIRCHIAKKMPGIWLKQCLWVTISLPWTVVGQHLGAGGLPGQRTPRTGASFNFLCVDFEPTIMKLETFQWKEAQYIFGCTLSDSVVPDAQQTHPSIAFPRRESERKHNMHSFHGCTIVHQRSILLVSL